MAIRLLNEHENVHVVVGESIIGDRLKLKEIACGSFETIQIRSCSTRLILPSWRAGTIPITKRLLSLFPPCSSQSRYGDGRPTRTGKSR